MSKNRAEKLLKFRAFCTMGCLVLLLSLFHSRLQAQHLRIFACAIANDSTGASLGASSEGSGLYQSDDTGKTWKHLGWSNIKCYSMDMVQSSNGRIIYEATGLGILRSTDYGEHWNQITDWRVSEAMDVAVNQKNPNEIYIATAHGPWRSSDAGVTWQKLSDGMLNPYCSRIAIDSAKSDHILLAAQDGLYNSYFSGQHWNLVKWYEHFHSKEGTGPDKEKHSAVHGLIQQSENSWLACSDSGGMSVSFNCLPTMHCMPDVVNNFRDANWCDSHTSIERNMLDRKTGIWTIRAFGGPKSSFAMFDNNKASRGIKFDTIKNVSSCLSFIDVSAGAIILWGTLDKGIIRTLLTDEALEENPEYDSLVRAGKTGYDRFSSKGVAEELLLPGRQIWTLKSFLVSP
jgi:hypothetical protein